MAVGLGGLYLLVRVRSEVHANEAEREDDAPVSDTSPPVKDGVGVTGHEHPYPHSKEPPHWVKDERIWERARQHVRLHWHEYRDPWVVVANVYEQMGGRTA